jgi:hypothetical protein
LQLGGRDVQAVTGAAEQAILKGRRAEPWGRGQVTDGADFRLGEGEPELSSLPNLLKLQDGYRVYDPDALTPDAARKAIGDIEKDSTAPQVGLMLGASLAGATGLPFLVGSGEFWPIVASIVGGFAGGVLLTGVPAAIYNERTMRENQRCRGGAVPYRTVQGSDLQAVRLCELADDVAATVSWREEVIDPDRKMPTALWAAVERAVRFSRLETRLQESDARGVPESVSESLRHDVATLRAELGRIEANLSEIFSIAHGLDNKMASGTAGQDGWKTTVATGAELDYSDEILAHSRALRDIM